MYKRSIKFLENLTQIEEQLTRVINQKLIKNNIDLEFYSSPFVAGEHLLEQILAYLGHLSIEDRPLDVFYLPSKKYTKRSVDRLNEDALEVNTYVKKEIIFHKIKSKVPRIMESYDLNCSRVIFSIENNKLIYDDHFLYFLDSLEILILNSGVSGFARSLNQAKSFKKEFNLHFNQEKSINDFAKLVYANNLDVVKVYCCPEESLLSTIPKSVNDIKILKSNQKDRIEKINLEGIKLNDLEQNFYNELSSNSSLYPYISLLNQNQRNNFMKFYYNVKFVHKDAYLLRIIQNQKQFFSQEISESKWGIIHDFFGLDTMTFQEIHNLLMRSIKDLSLDRFANVAYSFLKYQSYISIFDDPTEIVSLIYSKDKDQMDKKMNQKIKDYEEELRKYLAINLNYSAYKIQVQMITSVQEIRPIGLRFRNCVREKAFEIINSKNSRTFHLVNAEGESLVMFIRDSSTKRWNMNQAESPYKTKAPISHHDTIEMIKTDLNQYEVSKVPI